VALMVPSMHLLAQNSSLNFDRSHIELTAEQNCRIPSQTVKISASTGNPVFILSPDPDASDWLILPKNPSLGDLEFGIVDSLKVGKYSTTIYAIDQPDLGYMNGELNISVEIVR